MLLHRVCRQPLAPPACSAVLTISSATTSWVCRYSRRPEGKGTVGQQSRSTGSTPTALAGTPGGGRHETLRVCHLLTHIQAGKPPAGTISVLVLKVCSPGTCLSRSLPYSATSKQQLKPNPSINAHPKVEPGVPPQLLQWLGGLSSPGMKGLSPFPPPSTLPSCLSRLPASSQALIPAGGVGVASSCCLESGCCRGGFPHLSTQLCQMEGATHPPQHA